MLTERLAKLANADRDQANKPLRPKDASTLIILDRKADGEPHVLMGRRHMRHRFMPGKFVFPGGRVDRADSYVDVLKPYHPLVEEKLNKDLRGAKSAARIKAFAVAAIRETYEEAGLFIGSKAEQAATLRFGADLAAFEERQIAPSLEGLRFIARAITPPGRPRRYDTRFFAVWADEIADRLPEGTGPSGELEELQWLSLESCKGLELPPITHAILEELQDRLSGDPDLEPETAVPFYYWRGKGFIRNEL
ncbi:NUDIX hydrolase [Rhodobacteraceae bacterium RKSG542]|uniref:NUDIX hydrolase n=1 Tax=Pseudovibrio flavus TaxID=2529854 RepID=UPI0012BBFB42|nr:NUDIX hydrolase [Pseudovibrio flavus]MTI16378.1 NUDIX hydrolase [Pseudovibrio flavus]